MKTDISENDDQSDEETTNDNEERKPLQSAIEYACKKRNNILVSYETLPKKGEEKTGRRYFSFKACDQVLDKVGRRYPKNKDGSYDEFEFASRFHEVLPMIEIKDLWSFSKLAFDIDISEENVMNEFNKRDINMFKKKIEELVRSTARICCLFGIDCKKDKDIVNKIVNGLKFIWVRSDSKTKISYHLIVNNMYIHFENGVNRCIFYKVFYTILSEDAKFDSFFDFMKDSEGNLNLIDFHLCASNATLRLPLMNKYGKDSVLRAENNEEFRDTFVSVTKDTVVIYDDKEKKYKGNTTNKDLDNLVTLDLNNERVYKVLSQNQTYEYDEECDSIPDNYIDILRRHIDNFDEMWHPYIDTKNKRVMLMNINKKHKCGMKSNDGNICDRVHTGLSMVVYFVGNKMRMTHFACKNTKHIYWREKDSDDYTKLYLGRGIKSLIADFGDQDITINDIEASKYCFGEVIKKYSFGTKVLTPNQFKNMIKELLYTVAQVGETSIYLRKINNAGLPYLECMNVSAFERYAKNKIIQFNPINISKDYIKAYIENNCETEEEKKEVNKKLNMLFCVEMDLYKIIMYLNKTNYHDAIFSPGCPLDKKYVNTFLGFQAKYIKGVTEKDVEVPLKLIREIFADDNEINYRYILKWLGSMLKATGNLEGTSLIIFGAQGSGKSTFFEFLNEFVIGVNYSVELNLDNITGQFNSLIDKKVMVVVNEMESKNNKNEKGVDALKTYITDKRVVVEKKGIDAVSVTNYSRYALLTDNIKTLGALLGRRWAMFKCSHKYSYTYDINITNFWINVRKTIMNQKMGDMVYSYLMDLDISDFIARDIPQTNLREFQEEKSKSELNIFLHEQQTLDVIVNDNKRIKKSDFYQYVINAFKYSSGGTTNKKEIGDEIMNSKIICDLGRVGGNYWICLYEDKHLFKN